MEMYQYVVLVSSRPRKEKIERYLSAHMDS